MKAFGVIVLFGVLACSQPAKQSTSEAASPIATGDKSPTPSPAVADAKPTPTASAAPAADDTPVCIEPGSKECPFGACGGNSPIVNSFPVNGLRSNGDCNMEGVQLLPKSLTGGKCKGGTLAVRDERLVGVIGDKVVCDNDDLKGSHFVVRSWVKEGAGPQRKTLEIEITDVTSYKADTGSAKTAYRMTVDGASLCGAAASGKARERLGLRAIDALTAPRAGRDLVIPVFGDIYNQLGHLQLPEPSWHGDDRSWLNLACVDDSLAKRTLYGLQSDDAEANRAALLMLVANYCGNLQATVRGPKIEWKMFDDERERDKCDAACAKRLEAKWSSEGAVCVSKPRLVYRDAVKASIPTDVPDSYKSACKNCTTADAWATSLRECKILINNKPPSNTPHIDCAKCTIDTCKGMRWHSYLVPEGRL